MNEALFNLGFEEVVVRPLGKKYANKPRKKKQRKQNK